MADLDRVHVSDTRTAEAHVTDAPPLYTASGTRPLDPIRISVTYHIGHGDGWVTITGRKLFEDRTQRWTATKRSYSPREHDALPDWAREFVDAHRPEGGGRR